MIRSSRQGAKSGTGYFLSDCVPAYAGEPSLESKILTSDAKSELGLLSRPASARPTRTRRVCRDTVARWVSGARVVGNVARSGVCSPGPCSLRHHPGAGRLSPASHAQGSLQDGGLCPQPAQSCACMCACHQPSSGAFVTDSSTAYTATAIIATRPLQISAARVNGESPPSGSKLSMPGTSERSHDARESWMPEGQGRAGPSRIRRPFAYTSSSSSPPAGHRGSHSRWRRPARYGD